MWKVVAVFLLLLILVSISAINREGLSWMLTVFFAFLGVGIFLYTTMAVQKTKKMKTEIGDIKKAMGDASFSYVIGAKEFLGGSMEVPEMSEPEHPADAADHGVIQVTQVEIPEILTADELMPKSEGRTTPLLVIKVKEDAPAATVTANDSTTNDKGT